MNFLDRTLYAYQFIFHHYYYYIIDDSEEEFSLEELSLFKRRFENGYNLHSDQRYNLWLEKEGGEKEMEGGREEGGEQLASIVCTQLCVN